MTSSHPHTAEFEAPSPARPAPASAHGPACDPAARARTGGTLRLLPLRMRLRSHTLALDFFSGPLWRSGFGLALHRHFPAVFERLFSPQARLGRLYVLQAPAATVVPGQDFELGLSLFGPATADALACVQALARLGEMGLGDARGTFTLLQARVAGGSAAPFLEAQSGLRGWPAPVAWSHWLERSAGDTNAAQLHLLSPLRIKDGNEACMEPPSFDLVVRRLQGRLAQLCEAAGEDSPLCPALAASQRRLADGVQLRHAELYPVQVRRRSAASGQAMALEGLAGTLRYAGDVAPFAGLLALGSVLQLGGKTAFGFGRIDTSFSFED